MSRSVSQVYFLGPDLDRQAQKKENEGLAIQGPVETKEMYRQQVTSFFFTMPSFPSPGHRGSGHLTSSLDSCTGGSLSSYPYLHLHDRETTTGEAS